MSNIILILFLKSLLLISVNGQNNENLVEDKIIKTQYTILDQDKKSFSSFFGSKSGEINFKLIELKNLSNNESIFGVEVNINTQETEVISSSIAFANIGRLWGLSSGATYKNIRNHGFVFLDANNLDSIITFLNGVIGATSKVQNNFTMYRLSLGNEFEIGMVYDIDSYDTNKWGFIFSANESTYRVNYQDGISLLRSISRFQQFIRKKEAKYLN